MPPEPALAQSTETKTPGGAVVVDSSSPQEESWKPKQGSVEFKGVSFRYAEHLPLVLKEFSVKIDPCMKVGIVGRTGAGKSSLTVALFRLVEIENGSIEIDGADIKSIPVRELRGGLGMVPQDFYVFSGTIRSNLDVEGVYDDADIWDTLDKVDLKEAVEAMDGKLEHEVAE